MKGLFSGKIFTRKKKQNVASSREDISMPVDPNFDNEPSNVHEENVATNMPSEEVPHEEVPHMPLMDHRRSVVMPEISSFPPRRCSQSTADPNFSLDDYGNITAPDPSYYSHMDMLFGTVLGYQEYEIAFNPSMGPDGDSSAYFENPTVYPEEPMYTDMPSENAGGSFPSGDVGKGSTNVGGNYPL